MVRLTVFFLCRLQVGFRDHFCGSHRRDVGLIEYGIEEYESNRCRESLLSVELNGDMAP